MENLDGFRWVDYDDVWVLERDLLQLVVGVIDKRVLDEALLLLERKSVAYAVP